MIRRLVVDGLWARNLQMDSIPGYSSPALVSTVVVDFQVETAPSVVSELYQLLQLLAADRPLEDIGCGGYRSEAGDRNPEDTGCSSATAKT